MDAPTFFVIVENHLDAADSGVVGGVKFTFVGTTARGVVSGAFVRASAGSDVDCGTTVSKLAGTAASGVFGGATSSVGGMVDEDVDVWSRCGVVAPVAAAASTTELILHNSSKTKNIIIKNLYVNLL